MAAPRRLQATPLAAWERDGLKSALAKAGLPVDDVGDPRLLFWRFDRSVLTLLWSAEAFTVFVLSAVLRENQFRYAALAGLGVCLARLLLIDMAEANLGLRGLVFLGVGLLMLGMNAIYNRYRARFE